MKQRIVKRTFWLLAAVLACSALALRAQEQPPVFSGPQAGEELTAFSARGVYDDAAGKSIDVLERAAGKPLVLIFVHSPVTRPSAAVTRGLASYAERHSERMLHAIVWLHDDRSEAEAYLRRARSSLNLPGLVLVSEDGAEGPGALGLNREVSLTVLVAREQQVLANFALVQPSTLDGPRIIAAIAEASGTPTVSQEAFDALCYGRGKAMNAAAGAIPRELLAPLIRKSASEEEVRKAAAAIEEFVGDVAPRRQELGRIARTIVDSGKLENYGTPAAQQQLRTWARKFAGPPATDPPEQPAPRE